MNLTLNDLEALEPADLVFTDKLEGDTWSDYVDPRGITLTEKEQALFDSIKEGMDEPGCGWLHEVTPFQNDHVTAGVLGSLIEKGLVHSHEDTEGVPGYPPAYWVTLAD